MGKLVSEAKESTRSKDEYEEEEDMLRNVGAVSFEGSLILDESKLDANIPIQPSGGTDTVNVHIDSSYAAVPDMERTDIFCPARRVRCALTLPRRSEESAR